MLWTRLFAVGAGLFIAICLVWVLIDNTVANTVAPLGVLVGFFSAGALIITGSRGHADSEKRAWAVVGVGLLVAGTGVLLVGVAEVMGLVPPAFGPLDGFFIIGYVLFAVGLSGLPQVTGSWRHRVRILLDGMVGAVSAGALLWALFLREFWMDTASTPLFDRLVGSLYPALDALILVSLMIVTIRRGSHRFDVRLVLMSVGYTALTVGDLSFLVNGAGKEFGEANPNFAWYLVALFCFLLASAFVGHTPRLREYEDGRQPWWSMVAPYGLATAMLGFLTLQLWNANILDVDRTLYLATVLVALLVIARQSVAIQENRVVVEQERSSLVSSISHELRTPLTSMIGFLELLESDQGELQPGEREEFGEIVRDQAHYMGRIVMDLVMLSRDDHSQIVLTEEVVNVEEVALAAMRNVGSAAGRITLEVDPHLLVRVDGARVIQVIGNLVTNAVRYGGTKGVLWIGRRNNDLLIEVHDNGPGVPKKHQQTIWERFERGAHRYSSNVRGSGIGLAIVAAIAEAHKGSAGYRTSERLGGACFTVILPNRVVEADAVVDLPELNPRHRPSLERS